MPPKARQKRAKSPSSATPAPVPPGAGGAAAEKPAEKAPESAAKRPRIARILSADAQQLIISSYHAVQADKGRTGRTARTVAEMMGIAHGTVEKVIKEYKERLDAAFAEGRSADTALRPRPVQSETRNRDPKIKDRHVDFVMRCLAKQMLEEPVEELPSVTSMFEYVVSQRAEAAKLRHCTVEYIFPFKRSAFHMILQTRLGYVHKASDDDREQRKQQAHIIEQRREYLRKVKVLRTNGWMLWYLDETWVNKNTTRRKSWELGKAKVAEAAASAGAPKVLRPGGKKKPIGKGGRAIVIGIGGRETGVVGELLEIFKGKKSKTTDDYHQEMNATVFEEWLGRVVDWIKDKYPNQKHAIVMDNASYHSRLTDDATTPKTKNRKAEIIEYMRINKIVPPQLLPGYKTPEEAQTLLTECIKKNAPFTYKPPEYKESDGPLPTVEEYNKLTKPVLLECIPPKEKIYVADEMCKAKGVTVVRLPPYHCEFNPIELVWAAAKAGVAKRNVQYNLGKAMEIMREECTKIGAAQWLKLEQHAMKEEEIAGGGDQIVLHAAELAADQPIVVSFESSDDDDESSDEEGDE